MKRKVILITSGEFNNQPISMPSIVDFDNIDSVVFVVEANGVGGGLEFIGAFRADKIEVGYTKIPMAQTINIGSYSVVPIEETMKANLRQAGQYVDEVPEEQHAHYTTPTEIVFKD